MKPSERKDSTASVQPTADTFPANELRESIVLPPPPVEAVSPRRIRRRYGRPDMEFVQARAARLLVNAAETFPAMLAAIDAAVDRVDLETYTLRDDSTGRTFQQAMIRAALRGVRVRLLYDWIGSFALARPFVGELLEAGVKVAVYHPLLVRRPVWALNRRDHRKISIPSKPVRRALIKAARRGVFVGVVVTTHSDVPITACATRWLYDELLAGGVRLFEWPDSVMHAKTAVVDDAWSIIGSYNFDHRSLFHQLECVAVIADTAFAVEVREQILADLARCREVSLQTHRRRPWWRKAVEFAAFLLRHWL